MASTNEALADALIRHGHYIQRFGGGVVNRMTALLNRSEADIVASIESRMSRISARGFDSGPATTKRLGELLGEVRTLNRAAYTAAGKAVTDDLVGLATYEVDWTSGLLKDVLPTRVSVTQPPVGLVRAAATSRPFQGRLLKEWLTELEATKAARVRDAIRIGIVEGQTVQQMVRRIRGSRAAGYADGLMEIDRRGAAAMVRTAVNHTSSAAREALYTENADILSGEKWVATLDPRTCPVCGARDGKVFELGKGPRTPAHFGCRCLRIPVVKSWKELGFDFDELSASTRASMNGQVPANLTYNDWLKRQSDAFQDDVLGKGRAEIFRSGVPVDKFVDRAGNEITLTQLRQADPPGPRPVVSASDTPSLGGRLTAAQLEAEASAIDYVRTNGTRDDIEYAAAYFADGREGLRKAGERSSVSFTAEELAGLPGTTMVHNHPRGSSLSGADLIFAARAQLREIVAVPSQGGGLFRAAALQPWANISAAHRAADRYVRRLIDRAELEGRINEDQGWMLTAHFVNSAMDRVGVVAYKASLTTAIQEALAAFGADAFEAALKEFKWNP